MDIAKPTISSIYTNKGSGCHKPEPPVAKKRVQLLEYFEQIFIFPDESHTVVSGYVGKPKPRDERAGNRGLFAPISRWYIGEPPWNESRPNPLKGALSEPTGTRN